MLYLNADLQRRQFVKAADNPAQFLLPTLYAGSTNAVTVNALQPSGPGSNLYTPQTITGVMLAVSYSVAGVEINLANTSVFVTSGTGVAGSFMLPTGLVIPPTQQFGQYTLGLDITTADGVTTHVEATGYLANPAFPIAPPPPLTAFATATALTTEATRAQTAEALLAPLASPALTGVPTAPTAAPGTNTTQVATTEFVRANGGAVASVNTKTGTVVLVASDVGADPAGTAANLVATLTTGAISPASVSTPTVTGPNGPLTVAASGNGTLNLVGGISTGGEIHLQTIDYLSIAVFDAPTGSLTLDRAGGGNVTAAGTVTAARFAGAGVGTTPGTVAAGNDPRFLVPAGTIPVTSTLTPAAFSQMHVTSSTRAVSPICYGKLGQLYSDNFLGHQTIDEVNDTYVFGNGGTGIAASQGLLSFSLPPGAGISACVKECVPPSPFVTAYATFQNLALYTGVGWYFLDGNRSLTRTGLLFTLNNDSSAGGPAWEIQAADVGGTMTTVVSVACSSSFAVPTGAFTMALEIRGIYVNAWVQVGAPMSPNGTWINVLSCKPTQFDARLKTKFPLLRPIIDLYGNAGAASTVTLSARGACLAGQVGWREPIPVLDMDGAPVVRDSKYFVSLDCAGMLSDGSVVPSATPLYLAVWTYDPGSRTLGEEVAKIFYDDGTRVWGPEDGQVVWDNYADLWRCYFGDWGVIDLSNGTGHLYCSSTPANLLSGVHVLSTANTVVVTGPAGVYFEYFPYDPMVWRNPANGLYYLAFTYLDAPQASAQSFGALATGATPLSFGALIGTTGTDQGEGCSLMHLDGQSYFMFSRRSDGVQRAYDLTMSNPVTVLTPIPETTLPSQCRHLPHLRADGKTEHHFVNFSNLEFGPAGSSSSGPFLVSVANETSAGWTQPLRPWKF